MKNYSIEDLKGLDDAALLDLLGFNAKVQTFKNDLADLDTLTGEKRKEAEERITKLLNPSIYSDELGWIYDDLKPKTTSREEMDKPTAPSEI